MPESKREQAENPRLHLDKLLSCDFQLTEQDVKDKIKELEERHAVDSSKEQICLKIKEKVEKRKSLIKDLQLCSEDGYRTLACFFMNIIDEEKWKEYAATHDPKLITDADIKKYLHEYEIEETESAKENFSIDEGVIKLAEEKKSEGIYEVWREIFYYIREIADEVSSDSEIYPRVLTKFPEFCRRIKEYLFFVRDTGWDYAAESLIFQKQFGKALELALNEFKNNRK
ncbi:MAG: hypothetical protein WC745_05310 [Patescibacteria group bacterium]